MPIESLFLEVYSILEMHNGHSCPPAVAFDFFSRHQIGASNSGTQMRAVWHTSAPVDNLQEIVDKSRAERGNEGVVIYACAQDDQVSL